MRSQDGGLPVLRLANLGVAGVLIEGEFHAVWSDPAGALYDVSTTPGDEDRVLFLPDPDRRYEGRPFNNVRRSLRSDAEFKIFNRGRRATHPGEIHLEAAEAEELAQIQRIKAGFWHQPPKPLPPLGPNDPCRCGSGLKFKKCCGAGQGLMGKISERLRSA